MAANPFQWVLGLTDEVSQPSREIRGNFEELSKTSEFLSEKWRTVRNLALGALGFYTLSEATSVLTENIKAADAEFTKLATNLGGAQAAAERQNVIDELSTQIPVARDKLVGLSQTAQKFNTDLQSLPIEGVFSSALAAGNDIQGQFDKIAQSTQKTSVSMSEASDLAQELTGSTKNTQAIFNAVNSTTKNTEDRFRAIAEAAARGNEALKLQKQSVGGLTQLVSNFIDVFRKSLLGDPMKQGLIFEFRQALAAIVEFMRKNEKVIKAVMSGIGRVLTSMFTFFTDLLGKFLDKLTKTFDGMRGNLENFRKNIILPFVTFIEILKVRIEVLLEAFIGGFAQGAKTIFNLIKPALSVLSEAFKGLIAQFVRATDRGKGVNDTMQQLGKVAGVAAGALTALKVAQAAYNVVSRITSNVAGGARNALLNMRSSARSLFSTLKANPVMAIVGVITTLILSTEQGREAFQKMLGVLASALQPALESLAPLVKMLAGLVANFARQIGPVVSALSKALAPVLKIVAGLIVSLMPTIVKLIKVAVVPLVRIVNVLVSALGPALIPLIKILGGVMKALTPVILFLAQKVLVPLLNNIIVPLIDLVGKGLVDAFKTLASVMKGIVSVFQSAAEALGLIDEKSGDIQKKADKTADKQKRATGGKTAGEFSAGDTGTGDFAFGGASGGGADQVAGQAAATGDISAEFGNNMNTQGGRAFEEAGNGDRVVVESHVTLRADGRELAKVVNRSNAKQANR